MLRKSHMAPLEPIMKNVIRVDEFALPEAEIRQELLAEAQQKPVQHLLQVDVWQHVAPENDLALIPDAEGDCLTITERLELRRFEGVRVQVPIDYDRAAVVRALRKVAAWFEAGVDLDEDAAAIAEQVVPAADETRDDSTPAAAG
jgi:hypothetical protein